MGRYLHLRIICLKRSLCGLLLRVAAKPLAIGSPWQERERACHNSHAKRKLTTGCGNVSLCEISFCKRVSDQDMPSQV